MAFETFTLEIRVDHADPVKDAYAADIIRMRAKQILASLMLLQDRRPPQMSLVSSNMYEREKDIDLAETPDETPETTTEENA